MKKPTVGQVVIVYDRYRFSLPLRAEVVKVNTINDGVEVKLHQSNNHNWPVGSTAWVSRRQLRADK